MMELILSRIPCSKQNLWLNAKDAMYNSFLLAYAHPKSVFKLIDIVDLKLKDKLTLPN